MILWLLTRKYIKKEVGEAEESLEITVNDVDES